MTNESSVPHKRCRKCDEAKPLDDFAVDRRNLNDGRQTQCKACNRQYRLDNAEALKKRKADYYERNKSEIQERQRVRRSQDRERWAEYSRNYYYENRDEQLTRNRERYIENRDEILSKRRELYATVDDEARAKRARANAEWRARNPHIVKANARIGKHRRRLRTAQQECGCVTSSGLIYLMTLPCTYCGDAAEHIDHIHPLSRGGLHCLSNLTPACASCNLAKSATVLDDPPPAVLNCPKNSSD